MIITNGTTLTTLALHWVGNDVIVVVAKLGVITAVQLYDDESGSRQKSIATIIL